MAGSPDEKTKKEHKSTQAWDLGTYAPGHV